MDVGEGAPSLGGSRRLAPSESLCGPSRSAGHPRRGGGRGSPKSEETAGILCEDHLRGLFARIIIEDH